MSAEGHPHQEGYPENRKELSASPGAEGKWAQNATKLRIVPIDHRGLILFGAAGQFIFSGAAIGYGMTRMMTITRSSSTDPIALLEFVTSVIFCGALLLQLVSFVAIGRRWRSAMGYATFAYGLLAVLILLAGAAYYFLTTRVECHHDCYEYHDSFAALVLFCGEVLIGILMVMEASAYITIGRNVNNRGAAIVAGCLAIVGGGFISSWALLPYGLFMISPASIIAGVILLLAPQKAIELVRRD